MRLFRGEKNIMAEKRKKNLGSSVEKTDLGSARLQAVQENRFSRRTVLKAISGLTIFSGIALAQEIEENEEWNNLIKRGLDRNVIVYDTMAKSESFLYPKKINKRYEANFNMTRRLVALMKAVSRRSYASTNPGVASLENLGVVTDIYIPPVYYHEFVDVLKKTRSISGAMLVKIIDNEVYFINTHLHPLAALDKVPENLMKEANLDTVQKGKLVIGLSKKLDPSHEKYVLLGAI